MSYVFWGKVFPISIMLTIRHDLQEIEMEKQVLRVAVGANDEMVVNQGRLIRWSRQVGLIPSFRVSVAGSSC
ncbi:hypothetical protein Hanom_Chr01g00012721 [Helianthus anomalus]